MQSRVHFKYQALLLATELNIIRHLISLLLARNVVSYIISTKSGANSFFLLHSMTNTLLVFREILTTETMRELDRERGVDRLKMKQSPYSYFIYIYYPVFNTK